MITPPHPGSSGLALPPRASHSSARMPEKPFLRPLPDLFFASRRHCLDAHTTLALRLATPSPNRHATRLRRISEQYPYPTPRPRPAV
jgi:hypothetical protein